jgi:hypothetical protein
MNIIFIDYSEQYYLEVEKRALPDTWRGKFVQIRNGATEYLVFSPKEFTPYHADVVQNFCLEKGIDGVYNKARKRFDIHDSDWVVFGGGKFEIDKVKKRLRVYDNSMAYGRFDSKGLKEKIRSVPGMSDYEVNIE